MPQHATLLYRRTPPFYYLATLLLWQAYSKTIKGSEVHVAGEERDEDGYTILIKEWPNDDGSPGRKIAFRNPRIRPLGYDELARAKPHQPVTIPFALSDGMVVESDIVGLDTSKRYSANTTLESRFTSCAIGLVRGGWLPSALAAMDASTIVLVDRNVALQIVSRFAAGKAITDEPDFLDLFADRPILINPLLFGIEGNDRRVPTPDRIRDQLDEVAGKLRAALPRASILASPGHIKGAIGIVADTQRGMAQKQSFLVRVAPYITAPVAARAMRARWQRALSIADECGVPRNSLVLLAVLSSIAVPKGHSPAKRLLKFKPGYGESDAYNALSDLRALELFSGLLGLFPRQPMQLCTADKDPALFWTGIGASDFKQTTKGFEYQLSPIEALLPSGGLELWHASLAGAPAGASEIDE